jgi:hypothetical protein
VIAETLFFKKKVSIVEQWAFDRTIYIGVEILGLCRTRRVEDAPRLPVTESCRRMSSFCSTQVDSRAVLSGDVPPPTAVERKAIVRTKRISRRPFALTVSTVCLCGMIGRGAKQK